MLRINYQSRVTRIILLILLAAFFLVQGAVSLVILGSLLIGLGFWSAVVFTLLGVSGFFLAGSFSRHLKLFGAVTFGLIALGLWQMGTNTRSISPWSGSIDAFDYAIVLFGIVLGMTLTFSTRLATRLARYRAD